MHLFSNPDKMILNPYRFAAAGGGYAHIANSSNSGTTSTAIDTTGADLIVVATSVIGSAGTLSDSASNSWSTAVGNVTASAYLTLRYCQAPTTSSTHTVTVTGGSFPSIVVLAVSGSGTSPLGVTNSSFTEQAGSITPTVDGSLIVAATLDSYAGDDRGITESYVTDSTLQQGWISSVAMACSIAYKIQSTASATNPSWDVHPTNQSVIASFDPA